MRLPVTKVLLACAAAGAVLAGSAALNATFAVRADSLADRLLVCNYIPALGAFDFEGLWQSGNTLETLGYLALSNPTSPLLPRISEAFNISYAKQPVIVDQCFDDHQWWGLAMLRAFQVTGSFAFINRSAAVLDYTIAQGWSTAPCGGGVDWCPSANPYKNAITTELFISLAMGLHPYAAVLTRSPTFYLDWASTAWTWLNRSGMVNAASLVNDGLDSTCHNNGGTTWTYNQGTMLDGLVSLSAAAGNASIRNAAVAISAAAMSGLTGPGGVLVEPCSGSCDGDQQLFKGIFVRHQRAMAAALGAGDAAAAAALSFIVANARSLVQSATCAGGGYGLSWLGPCEVESTATSSSALDLLVAASSVPAGLDDAQWVPLGLGDCADAAGQSMPNCGKADIDEADCAAAATSPTLAAVAYDWHAECVNGYYCRIRTLAGATSCADGWTWTGGAGTSVNGTNGQSLTICMIRA